MDGSEQYQRIVGCGLMDHNNYLIGSVGFMSWNSWPNMYRKNATNIKVQLPLPTPLRFWNNWVQDYLHPEYCNILLVVGDTNLVFKGWCDCNVFNSNECNITDIVYVKFCKHGLGYWLGRCNQWRGININIVCQCINIS